MCVAEEAAVRSRRVSLRPSQTTEEEREAGQEVSSPETSRPPPRCLHRQHGRHQTVRLPQLWRGRLAPPTGQNASILWGVIWILYLICFILIIIIIINLSISVSSQSPPSSPDEENHPDGVFVFRRKDGCQYFSVSFCSYGTHITLYRVSERQTDRMT